MILYKYRGDSEFTEKIFTTGLIWLSTAAQLNDPFECSLQEIRKDWIVARTNEMKGAQYQGFIAAALGSRKKGDDFFGLSGPELQKMLDRHRALTDFDVAYREYRNFIERMTGNPPSNPGESFDGLDEQLNGVGIFSMSRLPDQPLMWAHYANDHKGICIGFEIKDELENSDHLLEVSYADTIPAMDGGFAQRSTYAMVSDGHLKVTNSIAFSDPALQAAIRTKPTCWTYEEEWRYVEERGGDYPWPGRLVEVVFGLRCPPDRREHYSKLVRDFVPNDVAFFEMRKIRNSNKLERVELASPAQASSKAPLAGSLSNRELHEQVVHLLTTDQNDSALEILDSAGLAKRNDAPLWGLKGEALGMSGHHAEALRCFERCIALEPNAALGWYQSGVALSAQGLHERALKAFRQARALDAQDASTAFNLGIELCHLSNYAEAAPHLREAVRLGHPRAADVLRQIEDEGLLPTT